MLKPAQNKSEMEGGKPVAVVYATGSSARNSGSASGIGNVGRMGAFSQMVSVERGCSRCLHLVPNDPI